MSKRCYAWIFRKSSADWLLILLLLLLRPPLPLLPPPFLLLLNPLLLPSPPPHHHHQQHHQQQQHQQHHQQQQLRWTIQRQLGEFTLDRVKNACYVVFSLIMLLLRWRRVISGGMLDVPSRIWHWKIIQVNTINWNIWWNEVMIIIQVRFDLSWWSGLNCYFKLFFDFIHCLNQFHHE